MGLFDFLFGSGDKIEKLDNMNPQQNQLLSHILSSLGMMGQGGQGGNYGMAQQRLGEQLGGGQEDYDRFAEPYMRAFNEQTLPDIAERYAGIGGVGALSSSGFAQSLGAAGGQLQSNLAQQYGNRQQNAIQSAFGQYNSLAGAGLGAQPFNYQQKQGSAGFIPQALGSALAAYTGKGF